MKSALDPLQILDFVLMILEYCQPCLDGQVVNLLVVLFVRVLFLRPVLQGSRSTLASLFRFNGPEVSIDRLTTVLFCRMVEGVASGVEV